MECPWRSLCRKFPCMTIGIWSVGVRRNQLAPVHGCSISSVSAEPFEVVTFTSWEEAVGRSLELRKWKETTRNAHCLNYLQLSQPWTKRNPILVYYEAGHGICVAKNGYCMMAGSHWCSLPIHFIPTHQHCLAVWALSSPDSSLGSCGR